MKPIEIMTVTNNTPICQIFAGYFFSMVFNFAESETLWGDW